MKKVITFNSWQLDGKLSDTIAKLSEYTKRFGDSATVEFEDLGAGCDTCGYGGGMEIHIYGEDKNNE